LDPTPGREQRVTFPFRTKYGWRVRLMVSPSVPGPRRIDRRTCLVDSLPPLRQRFDVEVNPYPLFPPHGVAGLHRRVRATLPGAVPTRICATGWQSAFDREASLERPFPGIASRSLVEIRVTLEAADPFRVALAARLYRLNARLGARADRHSLRSTEPRISFVSFKLHDRLVPSPQ